MFIGYDFDKEHKEHYARYAESVFFYSGLCKFQISVRPQSKFGFGVIAKLALTLSTDQGFSKRVFWKRLKKEELNLTAFCRHGIGNPKLSIDKPKCARENSESTPLFVDFRQIRYILLTTKLHGPPLLFLGPGRVPAPGPDPGETSTDLRRSENFEIWFFKKPQIRGFWDLFNKTRPKQTSNVPCDT